MSALAVLRESELVPLSSSPIQSLAFTPDLRLMACGDTQRRVRVCFEGQVIHELNLSSKQDKIKPTERIRGLAFSAAGETLYTACGDVIRAISMTTGESRWVYRPARSFGFLVVSPIAIAFSAAGELAVATDAGRMSLFTAEGAMRSHWWDNDSPRHMAFLDDQRVVGCDSFSLCTWRMAAGKKVDRTRLPDRVYGFACAPSAGIVCLRTIHAVEVWDMAANAKIARFTVPVGPPLVAVSPDGKEVFFSGTDVLLRGCIADGQLTAFPVSGAELRSLTVRPDGKAVVAGCSDGTVRHWDLT